MAGIYTFASRAREPRFPGITRSKRIQPLWSPYTWMHTILEKKFADSFAVVIMLGNGTGERLLLCLGVAFAGKDESVVLEFESEDEAYFAFRYCAVREISSFFYSEGQNICQSASLWFYLNQFSYTRGQNPQFDERLELLKKLETNWKRGENVEASDGRSDRDLQATLLQEDAACGL